MFDEKIISFPENPAGLYDPLRYMIAIGGKRIRPTLCTTAYKMFHGILEPEIQAPAAGLEVFHTFTLIHDDIMYRSPLRRGVPTVWKKWNEDTAILSGDVMLIEAYKLMGKTPERCRSAVLDLFSTTAAQVCEGQQYDMDFENMNTVSMGSYSMMIGLKTAVLLACSAKTGAIIGGASPEDCEAMYRYGYDLGMAFQIADDYLDAYGDEKVFGKPIGGDIINRKKSWLTVRALEKTSNQEAFLKAFDEDCPDEAAAHKKIETVKRLYDSLGVPDDARAEILRYTNLAMNDVENLRCDTAPLLAFAEKLTGRAR